MSSGFVRVPTKKLKIVHLLTGEYDQDAREYATVAGRVKRARIIGTVIDKKFFARSENPDAEPASSDQPASDRAVLMLDDGTGIIRVQNWNATDNTYADIPVGQDVEVFGMVKMYRDRPYIIPEIVNVVDDPNYELLRDLEIKMILNKNKGMEPPAKKVQPQKSDATNSKREPLQPIQRPAPAQVENLEIQSDTEQEGKISEENRENESQPGQIDDFKLRDKIYEIILSRDSGSGVSFEEIQEDSQLDPATLKRILSALEKETAIGETHPGMYQPL